MAIFKIINKESDYIETICRVLELVGAKPGTVEYEEREFLIVLIDDYEYRKLKCRTMNN